MKAAAVRVFGASVLLLLAAATPFAADAASGRFVERALSIHGQAFHSMVWVPPGYDRSHPWPCLVFLHGSGESGVDRAAPLRVGLGPQLVAHPERWPLIVVIPQKPTDTEEWEEREDLVLGALTDARHHWRIDPERIALTGMSQGGHGAWYLAARHPELWSAVVPIAAYGRPRTIVSRIDGIPVWAFHGRLDDRVLPEQTEHIVEELRRRRSAATGGDTVETRLTLYANANHDSWDSAYAEPGLPGWLASQHRKKGGGR